MTLGAFTDADVKARLRRNPLPEEQDTAKSTAAVVGTLSMIQEALRYMHHYGSRSIVLTDYLNAVFLESPQPGSPLGWAWFPKRQVKVCVAAALWQACSDMKAVVARAGQKTEGSGGTTDDSNS